MPLTLNPDELVSRSGLGSNELNASDVVSMNLERIALTSMLGMYADYENIFDTGSTKTQTVMQELLLHYGLIALWSSSNVRVFAEKSEANKSGKKVIDIRTTLNALDAQRVKLEGLLNTLVVQENLISKKSLNSPLGGFSTSLSRNVITDGY